MYISLNSYSAHHDYTTNSLLASLPLESHTVLSSILLFYHLDEVHCSGTEANLTECENSGVGVHDCSQGFEEAGVICYGTPY